jgi:glutamate/tyrosine decarboxylase-like PLP-dependent enzyme
MKKLWEEKTQEEINNRIFSALNQNVNYDKQHIVGIPGTQLDNKVFNQDASFLKDAPFLSTMLQNPNHIGCHTLDVSESFFAGTQEIEREVIEICATDILKGQPNSYDGYIASGGTEANIQAIWTYRNYFIEEHNASLNEICIITSTDSHYSFYKGGNILAVDVFKTLVDFYTRDITHEGVTKTIVEAKQQGKKYFIIAANMMTTMFGSVDDIDTYTDILLKQKCEFKIHVDAAFGGFYYPFSNKESKINFNNPHISSVTLDAHKMAQAPYGTGIFIINKGLIKYTNTSEASYVMGEDCTLVGSRSGANAIAIWMILMKNGPFGWMEKIFILEKRTEWLIEQLNTYNIEFYHQPYSNIVTIKQSFIDKETVNEFGLIPDNHNSPNWYKVVVMEHVTIGKLNLLLADIKKRLSIPN